jgi:hypothetical protein
MKAGDVNDKVKTVLGSIPASSDTVDSEGATDHEAVLNKLNNVHKIKKSKKIPLKKTAKQRAGSARMEASERQTEVHASLVKLKSAIWPNTVWNFLRSTE